MARQGVGSLSRGRSRGWVAAAFGLILCYKFVDNARQLQLLSSLSSSFDFIKEEPLFHQERPTHHELQIEPLKFKVHPSRAEVQSSPDYNASAISDAARRFRTSPVDAWRMTTSAGGGNNVLRFQLLECPPKYMASTFHVQSSTGRSIFPGTVGPRHMIEDGCGFYNASVPLPVVVSTSTAGGSNWWTGGDANATITPSSSDAIIAIEAFWTSGFRNYRNRLQDQRMAEEIREEMKAKGDNLTSGAIASMLGEDRMEYLARHLDVLPGFPAAVSIQETSSGHKNNMLNQSWLPNCSEVPIAHWLPVGVGSSPKDGANDAPWLFQSHKCRYAPFTIEDLRYWLAGLRVRYLADSHGQFETSQVRILVCPESGNDTQFFDDRYDCPQHPKNTFAFAYRFYRGRLTKTFDGDEDGISYEVRNVRPEACDKFLGIGRYNVTIISTPTWLFVYDTEEGLYDYVRAVGDTIRLCRRLHPAEMEDHVLLLQSPTAANIHPDVKKHAFDDWRQNHNFREEAYTRQMYEELGDLVDGIIPVFEWTLARNWKYRSSDGVHLTGTYYSEIFHLQSSAIISAMKFGKGWDVPLVSQDDPRTRWFVGIPHD